MLIWDLTLQVFTMARFILNNDYHFLSFAFIHNSNDNKCVMVLEMHRNSDGTFRASICPTALLHPRKTRAIDGAKVYNELEIYGVVIGGEKLEQLILELHQRDNNFSLAVNRQGLCLSFLVPDERRDRFYPIHDLFDWRRYGVNVPKLVSGPCGEAKVMEEFRQKEELKDLCLELGKIKKELCRKEKELKDLGSELEKTKEEFHQNVKELKDSGLELEKTKYELCKMEKERKDLSLELEKTKEEFFQKENELKDICLELEKTKEEFCQKENKLNDLDLKLEKTEEELRQNEKELKDLSFELGKTKEKFSQKEKELKDLGSQLDKTKEEFCLKENELNDLDLELEKKEEEFRQNVKELKDLGLDLEKTKEEFCQKEKELKNLESQLQEKKKDLRHCEKQLDEKDQELKNLTKRLRDEQNDQVIIGSIYREYCNNISFEKRLQNLFTISRETHVILAFARDYDDSERRTNGIFKEFFDQNVTPLMIANFKRDSPTTKIFLCIGDRSQRYPFRITNKRRWITNATTSLRRIIRHYGFDGIDVYYTRSDVEANDFIYAIGTVIDTLMTQQIITTASLAPCSFMHRPNYNFYAELYKRNPNNFDYVVFQTHDDNNDVPLNDAQALITNFIDLASNQNYPKEKLLIGHSILPRDWDTIPYPVILTALPQLIKSGVVQGTSVWNLTDDQELKKLTVQNKVKIALPTTLDSQQVNP
ncbi:ruBisCO-associated protein-like [Senna tora]|uniref:RuBisCO-associated protein-like n=1 Tax=Senna tora TaxID=362788 RepID=A0A834SQJ6_9FABA|nr:ruBisCO-associated protein-like [Senna tora]